MNEKSLRVLEYNKIIELLAQKATSEPGRALCRSLRPGSDLRQIEYSQLQTRDALTRLFKQGGVSFGSNRDFGETFHALEVGRSLSVPELLQLAGFLENTARIKAYGRSTLDEERRDSLNDYFFVLEPLSPLTAEIRRCILSEEEISDDASPGLRKVRRSIAAANDRIHSQLNSMLNGSCRSYLQDAIITLRDNRYCLPVKAEYKGQVSGIVHDQSSSGSTLFIEPAAVVNLNNQLREFALQEKEEIEAVLSSLSAQAAEHLAALRADQEMMSSLDFIFAKASLAMDQNASQPVFNTERRIRIRQGRHPLLDKKQVVPIDIRLGEDFDLLVVTGPNTGGKTVSLKTVGLFTLMGQSGLHIPAADRSELSVFTEVYADIGDEQSIEQSLSTFSSHMTSIVSILQNADEDSLCLFDELGAGTDPVEGAALAVAVLNQLHSRHIRTMATTHYSELKVYALSTPGVENACCEFDVETLRPTYRLLVGVPGKSNAFAISARLGLPDYIIDAARAQISQEKISFEDLITDLENSRATVERERLEIDAYKAEIQSLKDKLESKQEKIDRTKENILREANEEARRILQEAKNVADETIRVFQKAGPNADMRTLEKTRQELRGKIDQKNNSLTLKKAPPSGKQPKPDQIKPGDRVKILSMGLTGTVSTLPDHKGNLFVQCGILRSQAKVSDLILLEDEDDATAFRPSKTKSANAGLSKSASISTEINLLGKTVDEALAELDKYLDDAYLSHLPSVRIVHGKGTGALRKAVQNHLRKVKYVKSFRLGEFGEGDSGVTIAVFRE